MHCICIYLTPALTLVLSITLSLSLGTKTTTIAKSFVNNTLDLNFIENKRRRCIVDIYFVSVFVWADMYASVRSCFYFVLLLLLLFYSCYSILLGALGYMFCFCLMHVIFCISIANWVFKTVAYVCVSVCVWALCFIVHFLCLCNNCELHTHTHSKLMFGIMPKLTKFIFD